jgi:hypothetical protein
LADATGLHVLDGPFSISGVLVPGEYNGIYLAVASRNVDTSSGQWQLTFTVPEPALGLLSLGALAFIWRRESLRGRGSTRRRPCRSTAPDEAEPRPLPGG